ncbi:MAG: NACHT domain-containing protein, partial [Candidatus Saccharimonadales bacterium]
MSDLLGLAGMMLLTTKPPFFVETKARRQGASEEIRPALSLLQDALSGPLDTVTSVVFVTGDAGAGKTEVLRQLVLRQADAYSRGEAECLYFYVNAQGRALARLDEALATELQDLRASLTYHAVPSLVRNGILVPVIDGFDELLGVLGYEDAFSSLRRFIEELDGRGNLIASARSTYYQQEFLSRSGRATLSGKLLQIDPIDVRPWGDAEYTEYVRLRYKIQPFPNVSEDEFAAKMKRAFAPAENQVLYGKPFFVAKTADLVLQGAEFRGTGLLDQLVTGYIERERPEQLLDNAVQPLLTAGQIERFVKFVCDEMWVQETRALDLPTVRTIAELVCTE